MQERQVTIGPQTHPLPDPFVVMATMNPIDAEGTYALPLAQMDRFLVKVLVPYPNSEEEMTILERFGGEPRPLIADVASLEDVDRWRHAARADHVEPRLARYIVALVNATRAPHEYVERGASPRATLALAALARARAFFDDRTFVLPDDVKALAPAVLRHRVAFGYRIVTDRVDPESILRALIESVRVP
jgi:MoxR-like ATPase